MSQSPEDLRGRLDELLTAAREAQRGTYSPYSRFAVGAALLVRDPEGGDRIVTGANIENAAYSVSICAERVAGAYAAAHGLRDFLAIAVVAPGPDPVTPCGVCRQFLNEFNPELVVVSEGGTGDRLAEPLSALLPSAFGPANLDTAAE